MFDVHSGVAKLLFDDYQFRGTSRLAFDRGSYTLDHTPWTSKPLSIASNTHVYLIEFVKVTFWMKNHKTSALVSVYIIYKSNFLDFQLFQ